MKKDIRRKTENVFKIANQVTGLKIKVNLVKNVIHVKTIVKNVQILKHVINVNHLKFLEVRIVLKYAKKEKF